MAFMERLGLDVPRHALPGDGGGALRPGRGEPLALGSDRQLLGWSALLHTIGFAVSHSGYHKHGAYLAEHADLAGFSRQDRHQVSTLIRRPATAPAARISSRASAATACTPCGA